MDEFKVIYLKKAKKTKKYEYTLRCIKSYETSHDCFGYIVYA